MSLALRVRLDSDGGLEVESVDGRWLSLREVYNVTWSCEPLSTLKYLLRELMDGQTAIGTRGNPTHAQLRHLERNGLKDWNDPLQKLLDEEKLAIKAARYAAGKSGAQVRAASAKGQLRTSSQDLDDII